jgi:hypothetical protein
MIHEQVLLNEDRTDIVGVERTPEYNCKECQDRAEWVLVMALCTCEKGMEN